MLWLRGEVVDGFGEGVDYGGAGGAEFVGVLGAGYEDDAGADVGGGVEVVECVADHGDIGGAETKGLEVELKGDRLGVAGAGAIAFDALKPAVDAVAAGFAGDQVVAPHGEERLGVAEAGDGCERLFRARGQRDGVKAGVVVVVEDRVDAVPVVISYLRPEQIFVKAMDGPVITVEVGLGGDGRAIEGGHDGVDGFDDDVMVVDECAVPVPDDVAHA
jgi:hypothetical protein